MMVVQDCYTWILYMPKQDEKRIPIRRNVLFRAAPFTGEVVAGTRTIKAFGGIARPGQAEFER